MTEADAIATAIRALEAKLRAAHQLVEQREQELARARMEQDDIALEYAEATGANATRVGRILGVSRQSADHMLSRARRRQAGQASRSGPILPEGENP